ncbi:MAG: ester cyclase [Ferruginibacter sp.]
MKKILFILFFSGTLYTLVSCNDKKENTTSTDDKSMGTSAAGQGNLDAFNTVSAAFESGDVSKIDNVVAADFIDHTDHGDVKGTDSLKAMIVMMHDKLKDSKTENIDQTVNGDYVYSYKRYTGTSDGSMGTPAGPYDMKCIELAKFNSEHKATEHWTFIEVQDMMKMMPPPPPPMVPAN